MEKQKYAAGAPVHSIVHTPGPWSVTPKYFDEHGEALVQIECSSHIIGEIYVCDGAEGESNARLIAAAPDMLDALRELNDATNPLVDVDAMKLHRVRVKAQNTIKAAS